MAIEEAIEKKFLPAKWMLIFKLTKERVELKFPFTSMRQARLAGKYFKRKEYMIERISKQLCVKEHQENYKPFIDLKPIKIFEVVEGYRGKRYGDN